MDTSNIQEIVRKMVLQELKKIREKGNISDPNTNPNEKKYILVVLNQVDSLLNRVINHLRELDDSGVPITLLLTEEVNEICSRDGFLPVGNIRCRNFSEIEEIIYRVGEYRILLLPAIGFSAAKKLAAVDDGDPLVKLVVCALREGTQVSLATDCLNVSGDNVRAPRIKKMSSRILNELSGIGIRLIRLDRLLEHLSVDRGAFSGKVVTENTVNEFFREGLFDIYLSRGTVVTPLAWDRASELGMRLNRIR